MTTTALTADKTFTDLAQDTLVSFTHPRTGNVITGEFSQVSTVHVGQELRIELELIICDYCTFTLPMGYPVTVGP